MSTPTNHVPLDIAGEQFQLRLMTSQLQLGLQMVFPEHKEHLIKLERNIFQKYVTRQLGSDFTEPSYRV